MSLYKIQRILLKYLNPVILHYKKPVQYMKTTCHCLSLLMFSSLDKMYRHSLNSYSLWESRRRHHYIDDITYQVVLHYSITRSGIGHWWRRIHLKGKHLENVIEVFTIQEHIKFQMCKRLINKYKFEDKSQALAFSARNF